MKDKLLPESKFPAILGISALIIALCAAFFSVYGIATLFAGASLSAMFMASALELGKFVGTTFLYRYWTRCTVFLKIYLVSAILILMIITSLGVFGYLSAAFQKSSIEFGVTQEKIISMQNQKTYYHDKIDASKQRIFDLTNLRSSEESRMSQVLTNEYIARNTVQLKQLQQQNVDLINDTEVNIKDENIKIQTSINDISKIDDGINQLKLGSANKKDVQTFKFVADALKLPLDVVARWFILAIIFVFDPLAICLILAYNVAIYKKDIQILSTTTPQISEKSSEIPINSQVTMVANVLPDVKIEKQIEVPISNAMEPDGFFRSMFKMDRH